MKANAYGLGSNVIAPELERLGTKWFAVYDPWQAEEILEAGIKGTILILMPITEIDPNTRLAAAARAGQIHFALHSQEQMQALNKAGNKLDVVLPVHIEVDTGMSRGGN